MSKLLVSYDHLIQTPLTRYAGNPIIEPDPQRYYSIHEPPDRAR